MTQLSMEQVLFLVLFCLEDWPWYVFKFFVCAISPIVKQVVSY